MLTTHVSNAFLAVHIAQFRAEWFVCFGVVKGFELVKLTCVVVFCVRYPCHTLGAPR